MINKIIEGLYNFVFELTGAWTQPISDIINQYVPDLSTLISNMNGLINSLSSIIAWFVYLIPPITLYALGLFLTLVIGLAVPMITIKISGLSLDLVKRLFPFGGK